MPTPSLTCAASPVRPSAVRNSILLDLYLPDMSGFDFLASLKADPRLRRIPVVVMTSSETEADVVRSYDLQASGFVTKPFDPADFARAVLGVEHYWHRVVRLPGS